MTTKPNPILNDGTRLGNALALLGLTRASETVRVLVSDLAQARRLYVAARTELDQYIAEHDRYRAALELIATPYRDGYSNLTPDGMREAARRALNPPAEVRPHLPAGN